jgi:hypothetical protein
VLKKKTETEFPVYVLFFRVSPTQGQRCTAGTQPPSSCPVLSVVVVGPMVVVVVGGTGGVHGLMDGFGALKTLRLPAIADRPTPSVHALRANNKLSQSRGKHSKQSQLKASDKDHMQPPLPHHSFTSQLAQI